MASPASPVNSNTRDLDALVDSGGNVRLKQALLGASVSTGYDAPSNAAPQVVALHAPTTATLSNVAGSASSVTVLAANTARRGASIYNDSTSVLYLKFGSTASSTSFTVKMQADEYFEVPFGYSGILTGIWVSATGAARVTEITV